MFESSRIETCGATTALSHLRSYSRLACVAGAFGRFQGGGDLGAAASAGSVASAGRTSSACAAPELVAVGLICGLAGWVRWGRIAGCVFSSPVSDHDSGL